MIDPPKTFPPGARLLKPAQFKAVLSGRRGIQGRLYVLHSVEREPGERDGTGQAAARLGLAISRRVDKRAVGRNRIKRQARESFRRIRARLPDRDFVLLARACAASASNAELAADLDRLWQRFAPDTLPPAPPAGTMPASRSATTSTSDQASAEAESGSGPNATTS